MDSSNNSTQHHHHPHQQHHHHHFHNTNSTNSNANSNSTNASKHLLIHGKDKRALLLAELEKWNSAEQIKFLVDSMKFLSFSLIKFISAICNDLIEKQSLKTSRLNNSNTSSSNDFSSSSSDTNHTQHYSSILEEQANDILYFRVLSEKPVESKLKIILSYLPLLRVQTQNYDLNESLKKLYNEQIQDILALCFKSKQYLVECYELSLLASLHPIFDEGQQLNFKAWTHVFECSLLNNYADPLLVPNWINQIKLISNKMPNLLFSSYRNNENILKDKIDTSFYQITNDENQSNGTGDSLSEYKLTNFDNDLINNNDFNIDSTSASLNLSLHMQTSTSHSAGNSNSNHNLETNSNNNAKLNDSSAESSSNNNCSNNNNNNKSLLTRQHMPLKLSLSLPPQQTSSSSNRNSYSRGFNSLNHYDDINSSASSMNSFSFKNDLSNSNNNTNNNRDNSNYGLNSYSDFDYLNLENLIIPPLSSSSSVQSIVSSQFAGSSNTNNNNKSVNEKQEVKKELNDNGIKNITQWLKHLRLHKYTTYFCSLGYEEILALNDDKLIESQITLGARKKILTNIEKLRNRPDRIRELINIMNDEKCPLNLVTLENILNELTEISITPMKQQNSPPTSLALLNSKVPLNNDTDPNDLSQLFIDLLDKIQKFLLKQKAEIKDESEIQKLKELTLTYVKIIDKLFLTKAFSDVQNSLMAKLRNSVYDKNQIGKLDAASNNSNKNYRLQQGSIPHHKPNSNSINTSSNTNNKFQKYILNENTVNPLLQIKQRSLNVRCLSKTTSLPFTENNNNISSSNNSSLSNQASHQQTRFMNYSNKMN